MGDSHGKHAAAKRGLQVIPFLVPAALCAVAVALAVAAYRPLEFNPDEIVGTVYAAATELQAAEATGEKDTGESTTGANYSASDYGIDASNLQDGVYTGSAYGYKSTITVQVTVSGGKIAAIEVLSQADDAAYFNQARAVISSVLAQQTTAVDTVSGCTYSSKGILMAIKNALSQAQGEASASTDDSSATTPPDDSTTPGTSDYDYTLPEDGLADGTYTGTAYGYKSEITVQVTVSEGKIAAIEVTSQDDDALYFELARGVIERVLEAQSTSVDVVSGATYSSEGILGAVKNALLQAGAASGDDGDDAGGSGDGDGTGDGGDSGDSGTDTGDGDGGDSGDSGDDAEGYADGTYTAYAVCANSEKPAAFEPYYVKLVLIVKDGKPTSFTVSGQATGGDGDSELNAYDTKNDDYLYNALDGRTFRGKTYIGVYEQLLSLGVKPASIDVVTSATYSSRSIAAAYEDALAQAAAAYEAASSSSGTGAGAESGEGSGTGSSTGGDAA